MTRRLLGSALVPFVATVATILSATSCGSSPMTPSGPAADVIITIQGTNGVMSFSPPSASARVGQTVAWRNADSITHDIVQDAAGGFDTGGVSAGAATAALTMTRAGSFPYHCSIHPSMVGTLTITQ